jgi:uncharacterized membrane protein YphA (DoxX/SURF4 family)
MQSSTLQFGASCKRSKQRRHRLQRLFSAFPGGWPGVGLLLLRAGVGVAALVQGAFYLAEGSDLGFAGAAAAVLTLASGVALLVGFLTPISGVVMGLSAMGVGLSLLPAPTPNLLEAKLSIAFVVIMVVAIVFLGPGAYSLDARMFGRREIIIPPSSRVPRH